MLESTTARRVPILVWGFLALAALDLALHAALNWYRLVPYLVLNPSDVARVLTAIGPFLLAAGVLASAPAWSAGRGRLRLGAILVGLYGLYAGGTDLFFATTDGATLMSPGAQAVWTVLAVSASVALAAGMLLVADGLRLAGSSPSPSRSRRWPAIALLATLITVAAIATIVGTVRDSEYVSPAAPLAYLAAYRVLQLLGVVGVGLIGIFALRTAATRVAVWVIAGGAALHVAGAAWSWGVSALLPIEVVSRELALTYGVPMAVSAVGVLVLAIGFAIAAIGPRAESP